MFWLFPAISAAASGIAGGLKSRSDNAEYDRQMSNRKRRTYFAAFTGDNPNATPEPEKPSTARTVLGGAISGAQAGVGLGLGLQALEKGTGSAPNISLNPYTNYPGAYSNYMLQVPQFKTNPTFNPWGNY